MAKRCMGCMKLKNNSPICEHCGYNENIPNYPHQLPIGTVLGGQYMVGKVLGQGGFGITYIGWDNTLDAAVAIKEFYPGSFVNRDCSHTLLVTCNGESAEHLFRHNRDRFVQEAKILAKLSHVPGIVRVHNLFTENNTAYIIMEYVEGIDLKRYLRMRGQALSVEEMLHVMKPIMEALIQVHKAELVHRDISPDNIMVQNDGSIKLLDFGAAREVIGAEVDKELPQSTEAIIKHGFAPMEQYRRRGSLGPWTDVYSLCATIYYCLAGKVPADAPERMIGDDNVNWAQIPGLSEQQRAVLEKGMAMRPEERIASVQELYQALYARPVTEHSTSRSQVRSEPEPKPEPKPEPVQDYPVGTLPLEESDDQIPVAIIESVDTQSDSSSPKITETITSTVKKATAFAKEKYASLLPNLNPRAKAIGTIALAAVLLFGVGSLLAAPKNGWVERKDNVYYYIDGDRQTGWQEIEDLTYFFDDAGVLQTGWQEIGSKTYHFASDGAMMTGWQTIHNEAYYFDTDGALQTGWQTIDGKYLFFEEDGAWVSDVWKKNVLRKEPLYHISGIDMNDILSVTFLDTVKDAPANSEDVSHESSEGKVLAWKEKNGSYYDVYIAADGGINAKGIQSFLFYGCNNLKSVNFNNCFHTEEATSMREMFYFCSSLTALDLSGFDTSNVTDMYNMFSGCSNLTTLDLSSFDTSNVTDMSAMFFGCWDLTTLNLSNFDTNNVTDMSAMFTDCRSLVTLNLSSFGTFNVIDMQNMFYGCSSLTSLDISGFDTFNVLDMRRMFCDCKKLKNLNLYNWDVSNVTDYSYFMDEGGTINGRPWEEFFK